jgi:hypothetical protein
MTEKKQKVVWINRNIVRSDRYVGLCLSNDALVAEAKRLEVTGSLAWPDNNHATTWQLVSKKDGMCSIVCINPIDGTRDEARQTVALLAHEAVHVWQAILDDLNEDSPGSEIEAYGIQSLLHDLLVAYDTLRGKTRMAKRKKQL